MKKITLLLLLTSMFTTSFAQLTGTKNIPGDYADLATAISDLNTLGVGAGGVTLNLLASNPQTSPAGGYSITATGVAGNPIVLTGNSNTITASAGQTAGSLNDAIFKLIGADYVTIQGFTMQENAANTTTAVATNNMTEFGVALLYATLTNGAQYNTIQNNTISLLRTNNNSFGIYSNTRHAANGILNGTTVLAEVTSAAGSNSFNKVYGNTISNVNFGIVFIGAGTTLAAIDNGNDIGGASAATGNTITNWGFGAATAATFTSNTTSNYCIYANHQINDNISYNTITSAALTSAVTEGGIFKNYSVASPTTGTISSSINNNTITITNNPSAATTGGIIGIINQNFTTFVATATMNMNNNTVQNCVLGGTTSTTNGISAILNASLPGVLNMNGNSVINNAITATTATTGGNVAIQNGGAAGTVNMNNNIVYNQKSSATTTGQIQGVVNLGAVVTALNMNNNQLGNATGGFCTMTAANTGGSLFGVCTQAGAATCATTIQNNDIRGISYNVATNASQTYTQNTGVVASCLISSNTFTNLNVNTTGSIFFVSISYTAVATATKTVTNNSIVTGFNRGGASGTTYFVYDNGSSVAGCVSNCTNNNFSNITVSGTAIISGLYYNDGGTAATRTVTGNVFNNITAATGAINIMTFNYWNGASSLSTNSITNVTGQGVVTGITLGATVGTASSITVSGNIVNNLSSTGTGGAVTGLSCANTSTLINITGNKINTLSSTGASAVTGISISGATTTNVYKNKIGDLSGSNASSTVNGILVSAGTTVSLYNNIVGDLRTPIANAANPVNGINITGGTTVTAYYNTVNIAGTSSGALFGTSAVSVSTASTVTLRNNIFVNGSTPVGATGFAAAYRRSTTTLTTYAAASNNNLFYAGRPGTNNVIYYDGTNSDQTLVSFKARVNARDNSSVTENPTFVSTTASNASFLHIDPATPTQIESGAVAIGTISDDFDGETRNATTPDMGADEGSFVLADISGPGITYTNFTNTACSNDRTFAPVAISDASGVNVTAGTRPRLYYKKSGNADTYVDNTNASDGWKYVEAAGTGGTPFSFTTNFNLLFGGTPVLSDVIQYFVVAQDLAPTPNVGINNGTFTAVPTDLALTAAAFPITGTINSFTIIPGGLSGTVNVGAAETYRSLTEAGAAGLFNTINTGGLSGNLTVNIMDASITETGATALNAIAYNGCATAPYNLLIKPNAASTLTGSVGTGAVIKLNGADYVTIDGSTRGATDRSLTIQNTTTTTTGNAVIWLASPATGNGAIYNTIKNCNIEGNGATTTFAGMYIGGNATISVTAAGSELNSNNTITNNLFRKSQYGVALFGYAASAPDLNNSITKNNFGTAVTGEGFSLLAINSDRQANLIISGNEVQNVVNATTTSSIPYGGIRLLDFKNGQCFNNNIHDLSYTGTSTPKIYGIAVSNGTYTTSGNPSQALLYNNSVSNITSTGTSTVWNMTGILAGVGYGDKYYHNTVNLTGQLANTASGLAAAFAIGDANVIGVPTNVDVRNNIFNITGSSGTAGGNFWALYSTATSLAGSVLNYNNYNTNSTNVTNNIGRFNSVNYTTLAAWQTATSQDANSITYAPVFVANTDLHLIPGLNAPLDNQGTPIAAVTTDIDGDTRSITTPDMGVDEFVAPICVTAVGGTGAGSTSACVTYAGAISATGYSTGIGTTYKWLSASSINGPWTAITGATNPVSYAISPAITATTFYRLAVTCATNSSNDSSSVVTITINAKPTVPVSPAGPITLCAPATQTLDARATNAASSIGFQWLNDGVAIAGANSATYIASASGTYRARVQDGITGCFDTSVVVNVTINNQPSAITITPAGPTICAGNIQLLTASGGILSGTQQLGTSAGQSTANSTGAALGPNPFQSYYGGTKQQMIVTAAELSGLGMANGSVLSALAFQMGTAESRTFQSFVVKISNTSLSSFANTTFAAAGTVVRNAADYSPASGWNTITFNNNYTWNGTSNLLIETNCSNNDAGGLATNTAHYMTTAAATTLFYRVDNVTAATMDAVTTANTTLSQRNIMRFTFTTPMSTIWSSATNLYSNAGATTAYTGASASNVYFKGTTTAYTVTATSPAGCSNSANVTVTTTGVTASTTIAGVASAGATTMESISYNVNGVTDYLNSCKVISTITPGGASAVTGNITNSVRIDSGATKMGTARLYAARFYDVNPATNPASATGTVKLYFLQSEFNNYNLKAADSGFTPLPLTGGGNTDSLRILVYHGSPTGGYFPGNYSGTIEELSTTTPGVSVTWNAAGNNGTGWWEISFPVNGFSGYFISSKPATVLPIRVEYFRGSKQTSSHILDWKVTPVNTANGTITLERSDDSRNFKAIYSITATSLRMLLPFSYTNLNPAAGMNYYRLKLVDDNGVVSYSSMVALMNAVKGVEFVNTTPNPVTDGRFKLNVSAAEQVKMDIVITDLAGRVMLKQAAILLAGFNAIEMSVKNLSAGVYQIVGYTADGKTRVLQFVKQ